MLTTEQAAPNTMTSLGTNNSEDTSSQLSRTLLPQESTNSQNIKIYLLLMGFILALGTAAITTGLLLSRNNNSSENNRGGNRKYKLTMGSSDICALVETGNGTEINGTINGIWEPEGEITIGINEELYYSTIKLILESCTYKKYMNGTNTMKNAAMGKAAITCNTQRCYIDDISSPGKLYSMNETSTGYLYSFADPARECSAFNMAVYRNNQSFTCEGKGIPDSTRLDPRIVTDEGDDNNVWNLILSPAYPEGTAIINCREEDKNDIGDMVLDCYKQGYCYTRNATYIVEAETTHPCKIQLFIDSPDAPMDDDTNTTEIVSFKNQRASSIRGYGPLFQAARGGALGVVIEADQKQTFSLRRS